MRRTRWAVFTRMNDVRRNQVEPPADGDSDREWSVRVSPPERSSFMDGGSGDVADAPADTRHDSERPTR